ncbi:hypothetical protein B0J12DRAFT_692604 [Macrophomina phaseolina]|uniref:Uncharacterized protein n=1 Tax=Macrophomina phaseolina TaxID=35725 RepID=A0ABQ8FPB7_9PEZI|nr:hypothetical protein B0J12DRAFT_692604 [Macrophomina phaseolina]
MCSGVGMDSDSGATTTRCGSWTRTGARDVDVKMIDHMTERVNGIGDRRRSTMRVGHLNRDAEKIRRVCVEATVKLMAQLYEMTDPTTHRDVGRAMITIANSVPLRCICVGISPYENGILPTFATALAYSPMKCSGSTPSIQVLSQCMSMCASSIKYAYSRKAKVPVPDWVMNRGMYTARFAYMLRCSYACLAVGVAFVNSSPVITDNAAKMVRSMSLFSEWLGCVIGIHSRFGHKLTVVCMGKDAEMSVKNCFKANKGMINDVNYSSTANPALISRMNVNKIKSEDPITRQVTKREVVVDMCMGINEVPSVSTIFDWNIYPDEVLVENMNMDTISSLTRQLVDHVPEQLLDRFIDLIAKTYAKMDDDAIMSMMVGVPNGSDTASNAGMGIYEQATVPNDTIQQESTFINPFENMGTSTIRGGGIDAGTGSSRTPFVNTGSDNNMRQTEGPPMVGKRSTIAQLIDPTGKSVSQQTILISSMLKSVQETTTVYKESQKDMVTLANRQVDVVRQMNMRGIVDSDTKEAMIEYLEMFKDRLEHYVTKLIEAYGIFAGLPHVIEGDRGVYEQETQPVAPLMRRYDGSTMHESIYVSTVEKVRRDESLNTAMGTGTDNNTSFHNPFISDEGTGTATISNTDLGPPADLSTTMDTTHIERAKAILSGYARRVIGTDQNMRTKLLGTKVTLSDGDKSIYEMMLILVCEYMSVKGNPSDDLIDNLFSCMGEYDDEDTELCKNTFVGAIKNRTEAMNLLTQLGG